MQHLSREKCVELQKAGFPQGDMTVGTFWYDSATGNLTMCYSEDVPNTWGDAVKCPSTGELIEAVRAELRRGPGYLLRISVSGGGTYSVKLIPKPEEDAIVDFDSLDTALADLLLSLLKEKK